MGVINKTSDIKIFLDLEFDMKKDKTNLLSIGAVKCDNNFNIIDKFHSYISIGNDVINPYVSEITRITKDTLKDANSFDVEISNFHNWLDGYNGDLYVWGDCDSKVIEDMLDRYNLINEYKYISDNIYNLQDEICPKLNTIANIGLVSLDFLKEIYNVPGIVQHNALLDSIDLMSAYKRYKEVKISDVNDIILNSNKGKISIYKSQIKYIQNVFDLSGNKISSNGISVKVFKKLLYLINKKDNLDYEIHQEQDVLFYVKRLSDGRIFSLDISMAKFNFSMFNSKYNIKLSIEYGELTLIYNLKINMCNISVLYGVIRPVYKETINNTLDIPLEYKDKFSISLSRISEDLEYLLKENEIIPSNGSSVFNINNNEIIFNKAIQLKEDSESVKRDSYGLVIKDLDSTIDINIVNDMKDFKISIPKFNINKKSSRALIWSIINRKYRGCPIPIKNISSSTESYINTLLKNSKALSEDEEVIRVKNKQLLKNSKVFFTIKKVTLDYVSNKIIFSCSNRKKPKVHINLDSVKSSESAKDLIFNFILDMKLHESEYPIKSSNEVHKRLREFYNKSVAKDNVDSEYNISFTQYGISVSRKDQKMFFTKFNINDISAILEFKGTSGRLNLDIFNGRSLKELKYNINISKYFELIDKNNLISVS